MLCSPPDPLPRWAKVIGVYPPHAIPASDKTPPTVLGEKPDPQFAGRPPTVNLDRRIHFTGHAAGVPLRDSLLRLLRRCGLAFAPAGDSVADHPSALL